MTGDPVADWRSARSVLNQIKPLQEIFRDARMVRLFRATDNLGNGLAQLWLNQGDYSKVTSFVERTLENERITAVEQPPRGCILMNVHKSKGKEFDGVVIVEAPFAGDFIDPEGQPHEIEQGRRLLRVAITRAKSHVTIVRDNRAESW